MIEFQVKQQSDRIVIQFNNPQRWMGLSPQQAVDLANVLIDYAKAIKIWMPLERIKHDNEKIPMNIDRNSEEVVIEFKEITYWIGLSPQQALEVSRVLLEKAELICLST